MGLGETDRHTDKQTFRCFGRHSQYATEKREKVGGGIGRDRQIKRWYKDIHHMELLSLSDNYIIE